MELDSALSQIQLELNQVRDVAGVQAIERTWLGKSGTITLALAKVGSLPPEERREYGLRVNALKRACLDALEQRRSEIEREAESELAGAPFDPTVPATPLRHGGSLHPVTLVYRELFRFFEGMGYSVFETAEVEEEFFNFDALNVHPDHPARDMQDTFWCAGSTRMLMRTHASSAQVRAMRALGPQFRAVLPAKVFRNEKSDASHEHTFHQMDVIAVGKGIALSELKWTISAMFKALFGRPVKTRLRPGYFPFVEPGFEVDMECLFCTNGCSVCKQTRWIELAGCGLIHPVVLKHGGISPEEYGGFAYGMGVSRLTMLRHGIGDIRALYSGDIRFLQQF